MAATKILSVDDESHIELLLKQYFRRKIRSGEYEYFFARNGREALAILQDHPDIGIILCDINMPEMDGPKFYNGTRQYKRNIIMDYALKNW